MPSHPHGSASSGLIHSPPSALRPPVLLNALYLDDLQLRRFSCLNFGISKLFSRPAQTTGPKPRIRPPPFRFVRVAERRGQEFAPAWVRHSCRTLACRATTYPRMPAVEHRNAPVGPTLLSDIRLACDNLPQDAPVGPTLLSDIRLSRTSYLKVPAAETGIVPAGPTLLSDTSVSRKQGTPGQARNRPGTPLGHLPAVRPPLQDTRSRTEPYLYRRHSCRPFHDHTPANPNLIVVHDRPA